MGQDNVLPYFHSFFTCKVRKKNRERQGFHRFSFGKAQNHILLCKQQPLVENAITHGLRPKGQGGLLNISIIEQGKDIVVYVNDNGVGMDESTLSEVLSGLNNIDLHKYGLYNVNQRIRLTYVEGYGINIESEPGKGTCVKVVFPKFREGDI